MEQCAVSVWMCLVLELAAQGQRWLWHGVALSMCCRSAPGGASSITPDLSFFLLVGDQAASTLQLQAGEGEVKHTSKCTCPKQKAREAERLRCCLQCWLSVGVTLRSGTARKSLLETLW